MAARRLIQAPSFLAWEGAKMLAELDSDKEFRCSFFQGNHNQQFLI